MFTDPWSLPVVPVSLFCNKTIFQEKENVLHALQVGCQKKTDGVYLRLIKVFWRNHKMNHCDWQVNHKFTLLLYMTADNLSAKGGVWKILLLQLLLSIKNESHFQELKTRNSLHWLFDQKMILRVWIPCNVDLFLTLSTKHHHAWYNLMSNTWWSNLMQEIQFLEFMSGSNLTHAHSNCFI